MEPSEPLLDSFCFWQKMQRQRCEQALAEEQKLAAINLCFDLFSIFCTFWVRDLIRTTFQCLPATYCMFKTLASVDAISQTPEGRISSSSAMSRARSSLYASFPCARHLKEGLHFARLQSLRQLNLMEH